MPVTVSYQQREMIRLTIKAVQQLSSFRPSIRVVETMHPKERVILTHVCSSTHMRTETNKD